MGSALISFKSSSCAQKKKNLDFFLFFSLKYEFSISAEHNEFETDPGGEQKDVGHYPCWSERKMLFISV